MFQEEEQEQVEMSASVGPAALPIRCQSSDEYLDLSQENRPSERSDGGECEELDNTGSVESGLDTHVSRLI